MSGKCDKSYLYLEVGYIWGLYFITFLVVYVLPSFVKYPYFLGLLIIFIQSKKDYWWIAFFIILFAEIGGLFPFTAREAGVTARIPIFSFGPFRVPFYDLVIILMFLKSLFRYRYIYTFQINLNIIGIYIIVLYGYSMVIGMTLSNHIETIRALISFTMFFSIPRLINSDRENVLRFFFILFTAIFVVVSAQAIELLTGFKLGNIQGAVYQPAFELREIRLIYSPFLGLLCFIIALYFIFSKERYFWGKWYLPTVVVLCTVSIFLSATRGWIIAYSTMLLMCLFYYFKDIPKLFVYIVPLPLLLIVLYNNSPRFQYVARNIASRVETIKHLNEGDLTFGGTVSRVDRRLPKVMKKAKESPIIGYGFSIEYYQKSDNHVGLANLLLQSGLIGIFLFILFFKKYFLIVRRLININHDKSYFVFVICLIGLLIINATSTQVFGFSGMGVQREAIEFLAVFLACSDYFLKSKGTTKYHLLKQESLSRVVYGKIRRYPFLFNSIN